jgi:hypothetical protein
MIQFRSGIPESVGIPGIPCNSGIGTNSRNSVPELDAYACSGVRESYDDHAIPESDGIVIDSGNL